MATVTEAGLAHLTDMLTGGSTDRPKFIHWGTSSTAEDATQTSLVAVSAEARTDGSETRVTTTVANDTIRYEGTIVSASAQTIRECGLFTLLTGGLMFMRHVHADTALAINESITYTIEVQYS